MSDTPRPESRAAASDDSPDLAPATSPAAGADGGLPRADESPGQGPPSEDSAGDGLEGEEHEGDEQFVRVGAGIDFTDPNSPLAPFYLRASQVLAVVLLAATFVLVSNTPVWHTDVWAHLRFGEEIVRQRRLPDHEPFPGSMADQHAPYIHYQWLTQAGAYLLFRAGEALAPANDPDKQLGGGALLLATAQAVLVTLRLAFLYLAFLRLSRSPVTALAGVLIVFFMGAIYNVFVLRPQVVGELGFAALLLALSRPVLSRRALVLVPLVFLVWVNCHGSFLVGFVLLGGALAGRAVEAVLESLGGAAGALKAFRGALASPRTALAALPRGPRVAVSACFADPQFQRLALVLGASVAAACLNPHGPALFAHSFALAKHPNIPFMEEWKPLPVWDINTFNFVGSILLLAVLLRLSPRPFTPTQLILLLGFGLQAFGHARMLIWWIMIVAWVAVPHVQAVWERFAAGRVLDSSVPSFRKTVMAVVLAIAVLALSPTVLWLLRGDTTVLESRRRVTRGTPVEAAAHIRKLFADAPADRRVVFASETAGDYLLWAVRLDPPMRLTTYSHVHLFTPEHWLKCMEVKFAGRDWMKVLDDWGVNVLVVEYDQYAQDGPVRQGRAPGISNLVDRVAADREHWRVVQEQPVFVAERRR